MGNGCLKGKAVEVSSPTLSAFKVVVVGDGGSGKTSVIRRFVENRFEPEYSRTTDVDITSVVKKLNVPEHAIVTVELWDVPGQNDVDLRKTYYLDVDAVIVVVDISRDDSLNVAGSWSLDVSNHARVSRTFTESVPNPDGKTFAKKIRKEYLRPKPGTIPVLLLGNKYDLAKKRYIKEMEEAEKENSGQNSSLIGDGNIIATKTQANDTDATAPNEPKNDDSAKIIGDTTDKKDESQTSGETVHTDKSENLDGNKQNSSQGAPTEEGVISPIISASLEESGNTVEKPVGQNGHIGNGDLLKDSKPALKKIHPKDEKENAVNSDLHQSSVVSTPPEYAKSAVTNATSTLSILPPCVEEIERITEKYGFIAGVPVSARTMNGGVQEAIQSVLRRLVAKKLFNLDAKEAILERKNKNLEILSTKSTKSSLSKTSGRSKKKITGGFEPLQEVGIIEIDEVIRRCNPALHEAEDMTAGYAEALQGLKMICHQSGYTSKTRVSLEACIAALKEAVATNLDTATPTDPRENIKLILMAPEKQSEKQNSALSLVVKEEDGFPDLRIINNKQEDVEEINEQAQKLEDRIDIHPKVLKVLTEYREKFLQKSIYVVQHGDEVGAVLAKLNAELATKEEKAWETSVAAGLSPDEVRRILSTMAQGKARMRGTTELVRETRRAVQTSAGRVKAALLF